MTNPARNNVMNIKGLTVFFRSFAAAPTHLVTAANLAALHTPKCRRVESSFGAPRAFWPKIVIDVFAAIAFLGTLLRAVSAGGPIDGLAANLAGLTGVGMFFTPCRPGAFLGAKSLLNRCMGFAAIPFSAPLADKPLDFCLLLALCRTELYFCFPHPHGVRGLLGKHLAAKSAFLAQHIDTSLSKKVPFKAFCEVSSAQKGERDSVDCIANPCRMLSIRALDNANYSTSERGIKGLSYDH